MRSAEHKIIMGPRWHLHLSFKQLAPLIQSGFWLHTVGVTGNALLEKIVCTQGAQPQCSGFILRAVGLNVFFILCPRPSS